ncbi:MULTISPECIES: PilZ domain-containing protein [unclassified Pseudomonas]|uniref:PilZ domain-containing protein n=1 Tax=unclassified Pseudomonas TaxID=196821 RepID=UPI002E818B37|nr:MULTISPECIES: PilZ domain-containing protein [unclassified Pseudomonas]
MRQQTRVTFRPANRMQVLLQGQEEPLGLIADISAGGFRLMSELPILVGQVYGLSIEVPISASRFRLVDVSVICQWSRKTGRSGRFEQGFALEAPAQVYTDLVDSLMATLVLSRSKKV